ncbi:MAG TPA: recombinase family protein [Methylibium sp.]|uniref:recombinase family protein n=1 Tax=Methylibium sp. TaxID=2067992 RepID=UPI002DBB85BA|nr:recombinase family protein [Methylibium sp.]HEU4458527.1 recombinase family protein [Methylibium sp.]
MSLVCAIYTRKSSEEGLEQSFNSLDAQREASEAFVLSQKSQGWKVSKTAYDDGGYSGGNLQRPALQRLLADVAAGRIQIIVVYKVDRLTRSLADFAKLVERFDAQGVSFVSVTQQFNTTSSMGRLTLNVLLSFAQFEREVTGERIRDKIAASKRKGLWMGGVAPIGYRPHERTLVIDEGEAERVRDLYRLYLRLGCVSQLKRHVDGQAWSTPARPDNARSTGDRPFSRGHLHRILCNPIYAGRIAHKDQVYDGHHPAIIDDATWQAVQQRLADNRQGQRGKRDASQASLLAGMLFDEQGQRLTPSHAKKGQRRYRYYVGVGDEPMRLPGQQLEQAVLQGLIAFLNDEGRVLEVIGADRPDEVMGGLKQAKALGTSLAAMGTEKTNAVKRLVERIIVATSNLQIVIRGEPLGAPQQTVREDVPVKLKRCGMAMRLIVRDRTIAPAPQFDAKLIALIGKAQGWFAALASGRCKGVAEIAEQDVVGASYVARVIRLAFLAPDIVERITKGEAPPELTTERLSRIGELPMDWQAQRRLLGMDA